MSRKKVYCGSRELSKLQEKNTRLGTYEECKKRNQIRLYGVHGVENIYQKESERSKDKKNAEKRRKELVGLYNRQKLKYDKVLNTIEHKKRILKKHAGHSTSEEKDRRGLGVVKRDLGVLRLKKKRFEEVLKGIKKEISSLSKGL